MDLGIDLGNPSEVAGLNNLASFGLFPNPATGGRFNVSLEANAAIGGAIITVRDAVGRQVFSRQYPHPGSSFFKEVDMSGASPGIYFAEIIVDGERVIRRVIIR